MSNTLDRGLTESEIGLEAAEWLLRLDAELPDAEAGFADSQTRNEAFFTWLHQSPRHLRIFLETIETSRRLPMIDPRRLIDVESLVQRRMAEIIPLPGARLPPLEKAEPTDLTGKQTVAMPAALKRAVARYPWLAIAAALLLGAGLGGFWWLQAGAYVTSVGEQRTAKLEDGSFIYLNTDSRIEVAFTKNTRKVKLVRGEALFVVERDSLRPFSVMAGDTTVRAIGTQFNVRRRETGADVAVVQGSVQVTIRDEPRNAPQKLKAGEAVRVIEGQIVPQFAAVADSVAWRQRRLVFHDERLADVASEFNRYNRTRVRIEGAAALELRLSGVFDVDRPQVLLMYALTNEKLTVQPDGDDWLIRGR